MFEFVFHFLLYIKIPLSKFDLISMISILTRLKVLELAKLTIYAYGFSMVA